MKGASVRALKPSGLELFKTYLAKGPWTSDAPPMNLLSDEFSAPVDEVSVDARKFSTKFEMGMEVCTAFGKHIDANWTNEGLWPALSLQFAQSTFPQKDGKWFVGSPSRHVVMRIPGRQQDQSHRHLVKGAAMAVSRFGTYARVLMSGPHQQAKMEEQLMSRKSSMGLASSQNLVRAAYDLYFDADKDKVKKGANSTGAGSVMRLVDVLNQLDVNFDIPSLTPEMLLGLLPKSEFGKFSPA